MSTSPDQSTPQTEWDRSEGARSRPMTATTGLVALVTLRELAPTAWRTRTGDPPAPDLLPGAPGDALDRESGLLSIGLGWADGDAGAVSRRSRPAQWTAASW